MNWGESIRCILYNFCMVRYLFLISASNWMPLKNTHTHTHIYIIVINNIMKMIYNPLLEHPPYVGCEAVWDPQACPIRNE